MHTNSPLSYLSKAIRYLTIAHFCLCLGSQILNTIQYYTIDLIRTILNIPYLISSYTIIRSEFIASHPRKVSNEFEDYLMQCGGTISNHITKVLLLSWWCYRRQFRLFPNGNCALKAHMHQLCNSYTKVLKLNQYQQ